MNLPSRRSFAFQNFSGEAERATVGLPRGWVRRGRPDPDGVEFEHAAAPEEQVPVTGKQLEAFVDE